MDCIEEVLTECPDCIKVGDNAVYYKKVRIIAQPKLGGRECSPLTQSCYLETCPDYCEDHDGNQNMFFPINIIKNI